MKEKYIEKTNEIDIVDTSDFNIEHILECGQIFRYKKTYFGYIIYALDQEIQVYCQKPPIKIFAENTNFIKNYFDLYNNYANIKSDLQQSNLMNDALSYGYGIRILNQDPVEMIISFIISANNNIPRIKKIIESLCAKCGTNKGDYFAFPTIAQLSDLTTEDYRAMGCGYRSEYLVDTVKALGSWFDVRSCFDMPTTEARKYLMRLKGVGRKVADCILLFAYHKTDVFPTDTWIVQLYEELYHETKSAAFISDYFTKIFGVNSGYAQQYLYFEKMRRKK